MGCFGLLFSWLCLLQILGFAVTKIVGSAQNMYVKGVFALWGWNCLDDPFFCLNGPGVGVAAALPLVR